MTTATIFAISYLWYNGRDGIRYFTLYITLLGITFSLGLAPHRNEVEFKVAHGDRSPERQSYIDIHFGCTDPYTGQKLPPVSIYSFHSDHYVLLAGWISRHFPKLAEYKEDPNASLPADEVGYCYIEPPQGRIKPFGWQEMHN